MDSAWLFTELPLMKGAPQPVWIQPLRLDTFDGMYDFQRDGTQFLVERDYAILADEMGLGKTRQALAAAEWRLEGVRGGASHNTPHVLILCPAIAKRHWQREVKRWTGYDAAILDGLKPGPVPQARYIITNYDILFGQRRRNASGKLEAKEGLEGWAAALRSALPPIAILDEAHMLRGMKSRRTEAIKKLLEKAVVVWGLTGTPMPNHVRDIWALGDIVTGGLLGPYWPFARAYCGAYKGQYGWVADGSSRLEELNQRLRFWILGRAKSEVGLQLPPKRREVVQVDVGEVKLSAVGVGIMPGEDGYQRRMRTNTVATALRANARAKRAAVVEMAKEALAAGQKVVVGVYLREQAEEIAKALVDVAPVAAVSGDLSAETRDEWATTFRAHEGAAAFVCTIDSVMTSISLVGADLVIVGDLTWDPTKLLQFEGRHHRIGSGKSVLIRYVIASGTIDEDVGEAVIAKLSTIEEALGMNSDTKDLTVMLGRDMSTTEQIVDRLFIKLTGGQ